MRLSRYLSSALLWLIKGYQRFISPLLGSCCRFYPSCSHYAKEAIVTHGPRKGVAMTLIRLLKCGPWHPGGVDFVPKNSRESEALSPHPNDGVKKGD